MIKYSLILFLGFAVNLQSVFKSCRQPPKDISSQLNVKYTSKNIYRIPDLLKIDISKTPEYLNNQAYKINSKKYTSSLRRELFPDLCVKWINSTVRYGLFANETIAKGQMIGEYVGEIVFFDNMQNTDFSFDLPIKIDGRAISIDARVYGNELRFTNHSDHPNVATSYIVVDGKYRLIFFANSKIKAGQQLFIDYGKPYWSGTRKKIKLEA